MPNDTLEQSVKGQRDNSRTLFRVGIGVLAATALLSSWNTYNTGYLAGIESVSSTSARRLNSTLEQSLREYGDQNKDGFVSRAERDEFQIRFSKEYGLIYVSGFSFKYSDGRQVPGEDLIRMLGEYTGKLSKQNEF